MSIKRVCWSVLLGGVICVQATTADARFLQIDPVGYKDDMDLYAYVHEDPGNATDPTGLHTCGDGPCPAAVEAAVSNIKTSMQHTGDAGEQREIGRLVTALGKEGDPGVNIVVGGNSTYGTAAAGQGTTDASGNITVNLSQSMVDAATSDPGAFQPALAGLVGHETTHGIDARDTGKNPVTAADDRATEQHAYRNEARIVQGLANAGIRGVVPVGAPQPGASPAAVTAAVNAQAEASVAIFCSQPGAQGC